MSWVSENKFLTGFGAVMVAGLGTLGYLTSSAMDKHSAATEAFDTANAQLKRLQETRPSPTAANLKELLAQKQEMTAKIGAFQTDLKARVLPTKPVTKEVFQVELRDKVAAIAAKAAAANVERPKDFYLGFGTYQSKPPEDKAAPALARELVAIELVMNVLIKTGSVELVEFHRDALPEEGQVKPDGAATGAGKRKAAVDSSDQGLIERHGLRLKFISTDDALRKILTDLANHPQQLFVIRNLSVLNQQTDSPPRVAAAQAAPALEAPPAPATPATPAPATPPPVAPAPVAHQGPLAYVLGMEKITSVIDLEVLNIEEAKAKSDKPEKGGKKKEK